MEEGTSLLLILFLILMNGFFVAAEFAVVKMRPTRVEQLVKEGNKRAKFVEKVMNNLDSHLSAAQLGITLTSLGIGKVMEPAFSSILEKVLHGLMPEHLLNNIAFIVGFFIATGLHITVGEQVPKMWAIERAEKLALWTAPPLYGFAKMMYPLIVVFKFFTNQMLKVVGVKKRDEHETHSEEEIKLILSASPEIEEEEQQMLERIFDFNDRLVREIMVHRKDMVCIYQNDDLEETLKVIKESNHSRFPVCGEDKDDVLGYVNLRDLYEKEKEEIDLNQIIREIPKIYEASTVPKVLKQMQKGKHQIAIIIDEYGGVSGLITMEDIVEEIVGDIQDEFDDEMPDYQQTKDGVLVDATLLVDEINERFGTEIEEIDGVDTISGHVMNILEDEPEVGKFVIIGDYTVTIKEVDGSRIKLLNFKTREKNHQTE